MEQQDKQQEFFALLSCKEEFDLLEKKARDTFIFYAIVAILGLAALLLT